jgi:hypothetical protein
VLEISAMKKETCNQLAICAAALMCFIFLGFQSRRDETKTVNLSDAIRQKLVTANFTATGKYSGYSVTCKLSNLTAAPIHIRIPAGTFFTTADEDEQSLLVPQERMIVLSPKAGNEQIVDGFCTEASDRCPSAGGKLTLATANIPKLQGLTDFLKTKKYPTHVLQDAIWTLTDKHPVSNIYAEDMASVQDLRKTLCQLTGQKDTWYSSPQQRTVDESGNIQHETVAIDGKISFTCNKGAKVHEEVHNASGKVMFKMDNTSIVHSGNVDFEFKIRVTGWEKGAYSVKVMEGTKVLTTYTFAV